MYKKQEQVIIEKNSDKPKIICNKVSKRFLNLSESVALGLEPEPSISDFIIKKELGQGSFGRVFLATHKKTKVNYAIKAIDKRNRSNEDGKPYFRREIEIMYKIKHPNCVRLYGNFEEENYCYFIMEYIPKGNLYNLIKTKKNKGIEKVMVAQIIRDLINAIHYLHSLNPPIIHRDIKPENILLTNDNKIKLTDFGWANYINFKEELRSTFCGTPLYLAPEMIENKGHGKNIDKWCLGVLLYELLVGAPPFIGKTREILIQNILKVNILWPKSQKKEIDKDAKDLIIKILKKEPKERISLEEMVKHPFFTKNCPQYPHYLEDIKSYHNKPYIISKDTLKENNIINNFIIDKKKCSDIKNKKEANDSLKHISPRLFIEKSNYITNHSIHVDSYKNFKKIQNKRKENNSLEKEDKKLVFNKSAINFFHKYKKLYKKRINKNKEDGNEELLNIINAYEKKEKENKLKIEELLSQNLYLKEQNSILNKKLKEKEEELGIKEDKIKILELKLSNKFSHKMKNILIKNKDAKDNKNNNKYLDNKYNYDSFDSKKICLTSRTPEASPIKYIKKKNILVTPTKPYKKKCIIINNKLNNSNLDSNRTKESSKPYDAAISSTNINSFENNEIEKLRKEFNDEKVKHENDINNFIKEIRILQIENKNIKEKEKNEIIKLTRQLTENEKEIKKWRTKVKELEIRINGENNIYI